jgi:hypothetical protein
MEAKTTELIGVAITVLTFCGIIFMWIFGKVLKQSNDNLSMSLDISQTKKDVQKAEIEIKDIKEDITEIKIKLK